MSLTVRYYPRIRNVIPPLWARQLRYESAKQFPRFPAANLSFKERNAEPAFRRLEQCGAIRSTGATRSGARRLLSVTDEGRSSTRSICRNGSASSACSRV